MRSQISKFILAHKAKTGSAGELDKIVRIDCPRQKEEVVGPDFGDGPRRAGPIHLDVAPLVELELLDLDVVGRGRTGRWVERVHPLLEDPETTRVVEVEHVGPHVRAGEDVRDSGGTPIGLSVQNEVEESRGSRGASSTRVEDEGAPNLDRLDDGETTVTGGLCVSLRNQSQLSRRWNFTRHIERERVSGVEELELWFHSQIN